MKPWVWYCLAWLFASLVGGIVSLLLMWGFYAFDDGRWVAEPFALRILAMVQIAVTGVVFTFITWRKSTATIPSLLGDS